MTSRAFDLALFVGTPANLNDASIVVVRWPAVLDCVSSLSL